MTEEQQAYTVYRWDCPVCGEVQEAEPADVDPQGDTQECRECDTVVMITGTM